MTDKHQEFLRDLEKNRRKRKQARYKLAYENQLLEILLVEGVELGIPKTELRRLAGLSRGQLYRRTHGQGV